LKGQQEHKEAQQVNIKEIKEMLALMADNNLVELEIEKMAPR